LNLNCLVSIQIDTGAAPYQRSLATAYAFRHHLNHSFKVNDAAEN
jgi:hypothetical protein